MGKESNIIHIAWSNSQDSYSFISTLKTVEAMGMTPTILPMIKSTDLPYDQDNKIIDGIDEHKVLKNEYAELVKRYSWKRSNVEEDLKDVRCIIFPGGSDISPTLCKSPQDWHQQIDDIDYCIERDVSDYILMSYALEKDIPLLAICRGMQLLSMVSGASIISHIPDYYHELGKEELGIHRDPKKVNFVPHDVEVIDKNSLLYKSVKSHLIKNVPSWHHQAVDNISNTPLIVTGSISINGVNIIEAVENKAKKFCLGVQFHPEVAVRKYVNNESDKDSFTDYETSLSFFYQLVESCK